MKNIYNSGTIVSYHSYHNSLSPKCSIPIIPIHPSSNPPATTPNYCKSSSFSSVEDTHWPGVACSDKETVWLSLSLVKGAEMSLLLLLLLGPCPLLLLLATPCQPLLLLPSSPSPYSCDDLLGDQLCPLEVREDTVQVQDQPLTLMELSCNTPVSHL